MLLLKLAIRNISRNKRRSFLTITMMAFGYILFSFFISLGDGAYGNIIDKFIRERTGHFQIHANNYLDNPRLNRSIKDYNKLMEELSQVEDIKAIAPRIHGGALAFGEKKNLGVEIVGVDKLKEPKVTTLAERVNKGEFLTEGAVVVGKKIAKVLELNLGSELVLISQGADGSVANDIFIVGGIIDPEDDSIDDNVVYMTIAQAQQFLFLPGQVHELTIGLVKMNTNKIAQELKSKLPKKLELNSWQVVEKDFYKAMEADRAGDVIGRFIFMIVIAIGVLNTVLMSTLERMREFGVLRAIGTRPNIIFGLITLETGTMAMIGIFIGFFISLVLNYYFSIYGIQMEPFEYGGMKFDKMVAVINLRSFVIPLYTVLFSSLFVSIFPALKAARVIPAKAMREI